MANQITAKEWLGSVKYHIRFVHKVSPSPLDSVSGVELPDSCFSDANTLGKALRNANVLSPGARVVHFRVEGDRVVAFPVLPGMSTYWHSIIITPEDIP